MADLKLLRIEQGDNQKSLIDKANFNFSNLLLFEGGPYGKIGPVGQQGDQGIQGPVGSYGDLGQRGSIWVLNDQNPGSSGYYAGDFWINTTQGLGLPVYQFSESKWSPTGINLSTQDLFRIFSPVQTTAGDSLYTGYYLSSLNPEKYTLVISDNSLASAGATAYANPQYSKMVISSNGATSGRPILEFSKSDIIETPSLHTKNPRFIWTDINDLDRNYNLTLMSPESFSIDSSSGSLNFTINGNTGVGYRHSSDGFFLNLSGNQGFYASSTSGRIAINSSTSSNLLFSNRNLTYSGSSYIMPVRFEFKADSTDINPPLSLISNSSIVGGLRHRTNVAQTRNSTLFRVYDSSGTLLNLFSNGELLYNKRINSYQGLQSPTTATVSGNAYTGPSGTGGPVTVHWLAVVPTVTTSSTSSVNAIYASNGLDYQFTYPSGLSIPRGVYLWTPGTGGTSLNDNSGWLQLLNPMESITLRVRCKNTGVSGGFRFVGLGGGTSFTTAPNDTSGSTRAIDLTNNDNITATDAEFTIINLNNSVSSSRSDTTKWFKVYYSAWGGSLQYPKCGVMYIPQ